MPHSARAPVCEGGLLRRPGPAPGPLIQENAIMAVQGVCPNCQSQLRVSDDLAGKMIRCGKCGTTFTLTAQIPAEEPAVVIAPVAAAIQAPPERPSPPPSIPQVELAERENRHPRRDPG